MCAALPVTYEGLLLNRLQNSSQAQTGSSHKVRMLDYIYQVAIHECAFSSFGYKMCFKLFSTLKLLLHFLCIRLAARVVVGMA